MTKKGGNLDSKAGLIGFYQTTPWKMFGIILGRTNFINESLKYFLFMLHKGRDNSRLSILYL